MRLIRAGLAIALALAAPAAAQPAAVSGAAYGTDARQRLDVYPASGTAAGPRPVIVFFYGGAWVAGSRSDYAAIGRALAALGYVVVVPDYRLVPKIRFPGFVEDGAAAIRWTRANIAASGGDPSRIVVMGHSAGAYIAAMLALDPKYLGADRAAVKGWIGLAGPYDFYPFTDQAAVAAFAGSRDPAETQPVLQASRDDPPALIAYGASDARVSPRNSTGLARRLTAAGVAVTLRRYPGVGHVGILTAVAEPPRADVPVLADVAAFVAMVTQ